MKKYLVGLSIVFFWATAAAAATCDEQPGECGESAEPGYETSKSKQFAQKFLNYSAAQEAQEGRKKRSNPPPRLNQQANPGLSLSAIEAANRALDSGGATASHMQQANVLFPEQPQTIAISSRDRNRFVCTTGTVEAVRYSDEKFILSEIDGNEAYIKLEFEVSSAGEINYSEIPTDIFFKCGGETYSVIAHPSTDLSARTFYLVSPAAQAAGEQERSAAEFSALAIDDAIARIVELVMKDETPKSWSSLPRETKKSPIADVFIEQTGSWYIRGIEAKVSLYRAYAARDVSVTEWDFLTPDLAVNPVGISVRRHHIPSGQFTPVVIVEKMRER